jgi:hypothetical protein
MGFVHPRTQTPSHAIAAVAVATTVAVFLGEAGLVPILEVGAVAASVAWMAACASYLCMRPALAGRAAAVFGLMVTSAMILVKLVPLVPGHFSRWEWLALGIWIAIGFTLRYLRRRDSEALQALQAKLSN